MVGVVARRIEAGEVEALAGQAIEEGRESLAHQIGTHALHEDEYNVPPLQFRSVAAAGHQHV